MSSLYLPESICRLQPKLKGKVTLIREYDDLVKINFGEIEKIHLTALNIFVYDAYGNLVEETNADGREVLQMEWFYEYDNNNRISVKPHKENDWLQKFFVQRYYDEKGNESSREMYDKYENLIEKNAYSYDSSGNVIKMLSYDQKGKIKWKSTRNYDNKANVIEHLDYNSPYA